ncbi:MAG: TetR/AcrR family transcriptional regulator [Deltaproteobacteria bacterium]|nr:TetR/AcrR family transcriptional regulator [Deltaproteobacteria bacterium]
MRLKILAQAHDHFLNLGYAGAKLRNIARDAGVTTGALYHHFTGKDELFVEVCLQGFEILKRRFETAEKMTDGRPPEERIVALFDAYVAFFVEHRGYYELIERLQFQEKRLPIPEELVRKAEAASRQAIEPMIRVLTEPPMGLDDSQVMGRVLLMVCFAEGLFQCMRKGLLERSGVPFGDIRALVLSKVSAILENE